MATPRILVRQALVPSRQSVGRGFSAEPSLAAGRPDALEGTLYRIADREDPKLAAQMACTTQHARTRRKTH